MANNGGPFLDQAIHWAARQYGSTADDYAAYLDGEYDRNYHDKQESWDKHYERVRAVYNGHYMDLLNSGLHYGEANLAIVGPGLAPCGRELGNTAQTMVLPHAKNIVVGDFSPTVVERAVTQIRSDVNLPNTPVLPWLIDITEGFSTAYRRLIRERLQQVEDEDALYDVAKELASMSDAELQKKLAVILGQIDFEEFETAEIAHSVYPEVFRNGGLNKQVKDTYALSVNNGTPLPLHSVFLPMVIAGTGAAAEHEIWERYITVTSSDTDRGGKRESDETIADRVEMITNFYTVICRYNTFAGAKAIADILRDNPDATVLAVSDVSTILYKYNIGMLSRLDIQQLRRNLYERGVGLTIGDLDWRWDDEPEHYHGVNALTARLLKIKKQAASIPHVLMLDDNDVRLAPESESDTEKQADSVDPADSSTEASHEEEGDASMGSTVIDTAAEKPASSIFEFDTHSAADTSLGVGSGSDDPMGGERPNDDSEDAEQPGETQS